jgi:hypothetical protein
MELQPKFSTRLATNLQRAAIMSTDEHIVILHGMCLVIVYIAVFGFLQGFTFLFQYTYNFSRGIVCTSFAVIAVGIAILTCKALVGHLFPRLIPFPGSLDMSRNGIGGSYLKTTPEIYLIPSFPSQGSNADPEIRQIYPPSPPASTSTKTPAGNSSTPTTQTQNHP